MTKTLKQLVHVLWAIKKDLHVIASNMGSSNNNLHKYSVSITSGQAGSNDSMDMVQIEHELIRLGQDEEMTITRR
ncbi:hypothetical protein QMG96_05895 [Lactiplantibacillus plantarum]|uniref:hypothetical protein n=1 Tax=Lactiplantibacillus plantarum TaxID=1590 RepID=UPI0007B54F79|nr:hypothetical protein [Lactiplantibacillus plantarum]QLK66736.1 hypothetical protein LACP0422_15265 [Lactiplantibacillus plantarum]WKE63359.1 hypothetical protein QMG96_05895 [Lactiplantibacillus plantarum]WOD60542.1 hypothetical protein NXS20_05860 [Lactiplantibacillus plantarum]WQH17757.1 hypothetical protein T1I15_10230 [Lactiplantibacillus plantarum]